MSNRLARESSPYLRQHAQNPVDWFPWGEEAFAAARARDLPIFLSIGYSTCHWCHVMERESFEDAAVAAVLNETCVSIKVDREERPDVDRVYMAFVQATTGQGGWPMSVWLTPDLKPFHGGTYFPPSGRWGRPGFVDLLREIARVWRDERPKVLAASSVVVDRLPRSSRTTRTDAGAGAIPGLDALADAADRVRPHLRPPLRRLRRCAEVPAPVRAAPAAPRLAGTTGRDDSATWWWRRSARWPRAACAITSAAASIATRSTSAGGCRTSRRCSTTRRSSCSR